MFNSKILLYSINIWHYSYILSFFNFIFSLMKILHIDIKINYFYQNKNTLSIYIFTLSYCNYIFYNKMIYSIDIVPGVQNFSPVLI